MMSLMHKNIKEYTLGCKLTSCSHFPGGATFRYIDGHIAHVQCAGITTLNIQGGSYAWHKFTFEQLKEKNKVIYADDGILECKYMRNIPIDYYDEIYCPMSILISSMFRKYFDVLGLGIDVKVNGKNRFWRIKIKRNNKEIKEN